jgi:hypothetical protein
MNKVLLLLLGTLLRLILTTAVNHFYRLDMTVLTNAATNWRLRLTQSAGTATPLAGSFYTIEKVGPSTGIYAS